MKCMARGRTALDPENEDPNQRRRMADAADLDERQEVIIREFQERHQNVQENFDRQNFELGLAEAGEDLVNFNGEIEHHQDNNNDNWQQEQADQH